MNNQKQTKLKNIRKESPLSCILKSIVPAIAAMIFSQNVLAINQYQLDAAVGYLYSESNDGIESTLLVVGNRVFCLPV